MTGTWADSENALEHARGVLAKRYSGEVVTIIAPFDIAHVGWEADHRGAFIRHGNTLEIVIIDDTGGDDRPVVTRVQDQMFEYARLLGTTRGILDRYRAAGGRMPEEDFDAAMAEVAPYFAAPGDENLSDIELLESSTEMTRDHDLRAVDGSLWRLRRRDGESDADYAERRQERARQAETLKTYPLDWSDFEMINGPTPNGFLVSQIDDLAAIAKRITDDETLQAVVTTWREILSAVPLPGEMPADVADAIKRRLKD